jgi:hypothetical protein
MKRRIERKSLFHALREFYEDPRATSSVIKDRTPLEHCPTHLSSSLYRCLSREVVCACFELGQQDDRPSSHLGRLRLVNDIRADQDYDYAEFNTVFEPAKSHSLLESRQWQRLKIRVPL